MNTNKSELNEKQKTLLDEILEETKNEAKNEKENLIPLGIAITAGGIMSFVAVPIALQTQTLHNYHFVVALIGAGIIGLVFKIYKFFKIRKEMEDIENLDLEKDPEDVRKKIKEYVKPRSNQ